MDKQAARRVLHDVINGIIPLGSTEETEAFEALEAAGCDVEDAVMAVQAVTSLDPNDPEQDTAFVAQLRQRACKDLNNAIDGV